VIKVSIKNMTFEELCKKMKAEGWTRKDFKDSKHYRGWYYRTRKTIERSGKWVIDHPLTVFYRPIN